MPLIYQPSTKPSSFSFCWLRFPSPKKQLSGCGMARRFGEAVSHFMRGTLPGVLAGCLVTFLFLGALLLPCGNWVTFLRGKRSPFSILFFKEERLS